MLKLIALYRTPDEVEAFEQHYFTIHIPLVKRLPGLRKLEVTKITGAPLGGTPYHIMAEMYFDSLDALNAANASPEGKETTRDLMSFGARYITLFFGEVHDLPPAID